MTVTAGLYCISSQCFTHMEYTLGCRCTQENLLYILMILGNVKFSALHQGVAELDFNKYSNKYSNIYAVFYFNLSNYSAN